MNFKKVFEEWKWTILVLLIILLIGFAIRIINLTLLPVFVDEAIYVRWSQVMANEPTLRFLPLSDGKQPFFMWVLMFLIKFFENPLYIGRLISVFTGTGTAIGIFTLSYLLFKNKLVSLFSVFLYTLSPFAVFFDRMALVDSMLSCFGIWTAIFGFLTAKCKRLDLAMFTGFLLGFAVLTKSPAIFIALLLPTFYFLTNLKGIWRLGITYLIAFAMYNIQRLGPNFEMLSLRTADYILPVSHVWTNFFDPLIPHLKDVVVWFFSMGPISILVIWLLSYLVDYKKYLKEKIILTLWFLFPIFVQAELGVSFTARYILFTLPYFFILTGLVFVSKVKWLRVVGYGLAVIFVIQSLIFNFHLLTNPERAKLPRGERSGYLEEWTAGQGIREIASYLKYQVTSLKYQEKIVVGTEGYFGTLPDGLQLYVNNTLQIIVVGVGVIIEDVPKSLKESVDAGNKTYLVVNKSRFRGDVEKMNMKLIASYPKGLRLTDSDQYARFGPQEELLFFEFIR